MGHFRLHFANSNLFLSRLNNHFSNKQSFPSWNLARNILIQKNKWHLLGSYENWVSSLILFATYHPLSCESSQAENMRRNLTMNCKMMIYVMNFFKTIYPGYLSWSYILVCICVILRLRMVDCYDTGDVDSTDQKKTYNRFYLSKSPTLHIYLTATPSFPRGWICSSHQQNCSNDLSGSVEAFPGCGVSKCSWFGNAYFNLIFFEGIFSNDERPTCHMR